VQKETARQLLARSLNTPYRQTLARSQLTNRRWLITGAGLQLYQDQADLTDKLLGPSIVLP
jgi:hypothetical protein